jgi:hypothetical protein
MGLLLPEINLNCANIIQYLARLCKFGGSLGISVVMYQIWEWLKFEAKHPISRPYEVPGED